MIPAFRRVLLCAALVVTSGVLVTASAHAQKLTSSIQGRSFAIVDGGGAFRFPLDFSGVPNVPLTNTSATSLTITNTQWQFSDANYTFIDSGIDKDISLLGGQAQTLTLAPNQTITYAPGFTGSAQYLVNFARTVIGGFPETGTDVTVTLFGFTQDDLTPNQNLGNVTFHILTQSQFAATVPEVGTLPLLLLIGGIFTGSHILRQRRRRSVHR